MFRQAVKNYHNLCIFDTLFKQIRTTKVFDQKRLEMTFAFCTYIYRILSTYYIHYSILNNFVLIMKSLIKYVISFCSLIFCFSFTFFYNRHKYLLLHLKNHVMNIYLESRGIRLRYLVIYHLQVGCKGCYLLFCFFSCDNST